MLKRVRPCFALFDRDKTIFAKRVDVIVEELTLSYNVAPENFRIGPENFAAIGHDFRLFVLHLNPSREGARMPKPPQSVTIPAGKLPGASFSAYPLGSWLKRKPPGSLPPNTAETRSLILSL